MLVLKQAKVTFGSLSCSARCFTWSLTFDAAGIHTLRSNPEYTSATMSNKVSAPFSIAFQMDVSLLLRFLNMPCQDLVDNIVTWDLATFSQKLKKLSILFQFSRNFFQKWKLLCALRAHVTKSLLVTYSVNLRCKKTKLTEVKLLGRTIPIIKKLL